MSNGMARYLGRTSLAEQLDRTNRGRQHRTHVPECCFAGSWAGLSRTGRPTNNSCRLLCPRNWRRFTAGSTFKTECCIQSSRNWRRTAAVGKDTTEFGSFCSRGRISAATGIADVPKTGPFSPRKRYRQSTSIYAPGRYSTGYRCWDRQSHSSTGIANSAAGGRLQCNILARNCLVENSCEVA